MAATKIFGGDILNHLFREAASPRLDSYWLALFTTATDDDGGGTEVDIADWSNYARFELLAGSGNTLFDPATDVTGDRVGVANTSQIEIVGSATLVNPVTVTHAAIMDDSDVGYGDMLVEAALNSSIGIQAGQPVRIPAGQLIVSL